MGRITPEVETAYFKSFPQHREIISAFSKDFDINYGRVYHKYGTVVHLFLAKANKPIATQFGFNEEILIVYSHFDRLEPRTIQAIEAAMSDAPFSLRADPLFFFLITNDPSGSQWVDQYLFDHPQFRTPIVFTETSLLENSANKNFVRNTLYKTLFSRDIFDYQLPLDQDLYFFGRSRDFNSIMDSIRKSQNRGIFGLRKTGKTSLIFKVRRAAKQNKIAHCIYIDCKLPSIRNKTWKKLIDHVCDEIEKSTRKRDSVNTKSEEADDRLKSILLRLSDKEKVCIIFDEIEYISPLAQRDKHWISEFVDFWQTMWSIQSEVRKLSFIVAGVNPYVTEIDLIDGIQNPMFGIVQGITLTGLDHDACVTMISRIGRQMGLHFENDSLDYLHDRYGGHPLLTRMACSFINARLSEQGIPRPIKISEKMLKDGEQSRDADLSFYCRHIVSELEVFYKEEYQMLIMLSRGNVVDFVELAAEPQWIRHLKGYGILEFDRSARPKFRIPALQSYIATEAARVDGTHEPREIVPQHEREHWLARRKSGILTEFRTLLHAIADKGIPSPFTSYYLPEANRIEAMKVVKDWGEFQSFVNNLNLCLAETIDSGRGTKYFFGEFKSTFPSLFNSILRVRTFRNNADHLRLNKNVETVFNQFIKADLMNKSLGTYKEPWFILQQTCIDELLAALLFEINNLS